LLRFGPVLGIIFDKGIWRDDVDKYFCLGFVFFFLFDGLLMWAMEDVKLVMIQLLLCLVVAKKQHKYLGEISVGTIFVTGTGPLGVGICMDGCCSVCFLFILTLSGWGSWV
jgi:hypothetical protein